MHVSDEEQSKKQKMLALIPLATMLWIVTLDRGVST
jgi:hypothetical protein